LAIITTALTRPNTGVQGSESNPLTWTNPNFITTASDASFAEAPVETFAFDREFKDQTVVLLNASGVPFTLNKAIATAWPTFGGFETIQYGGASDLWGLASLSVSTVNSVNFGLSLIVSFTDPGGTQLSKSLIGRNFAFAIPTDANILGVTAEIRRTAADIFVGLGARVSFFKLAITYEVEDSGSYRRFINGGACGKGGFI